MEELLHQQQQVVVEQTSFINTIILSIWYPLA